MKPGRWRWLLLVAGLAVVVLLGRRAGAELPTFAAWVQGLGAWAPIAFIVGYVVAAVAFIPGSFLTLAAGAVFGLGRGALFAFLGATLGAAAAFFVSRHLARSAVERRLASDDRFRAVDRAIGRQGGRIVFLLRLSPLFPYTLLNYALGLTTVRFRDYLLASAGMIPGTLLYAYYGKVAGDVAQLAGGAAAPRGTAYYVVLGMGLVATVVATAVITRTARRALTDATTGEPDR
ncbi:MAG: TVP38/TMEM64 family protein [Gemmatimonadales bacterium]|nr:TVP38/TMEM64 family protein [Gemmatimonadales bacterium]